MQDSDKPGSSVVEIQCLLDSVGATELVIDLIVNTKNDQVFEESILLGIALLQGGNTQIQVGSTGFPILIVPCFWRLVFTTALPPNQNSFHNQLHKQANSEKFFKVFYDRMRLAQQEIRATVSVNMFEVGSRKSYDSDANSRRMKKGRLK